MRRKLILNMKKKYKIDPAFAKFIQQDRSKFESYIQKKVHLYLACSFTAKDVFYTVDKLLENEDATICIDWGRPNDAPLNATLNEFLVGYNIIKEVKEVKEVKEENERGVDGKKVFHF